jgi:hypothetical protein
VIRYRHFCIIDRLVTLTTGLAVATQHGARAVTDATHIFFSNGCQYYIAGRYAAFAGFAPVSGNVLHHAIENFLKGGLSKTKTLEQLKGLGHNLNSLWTQFKVQANDPQLAGFDTVISTLHEFENIRYPNSVLDLGMLCTIEITKAGAADVAAMIAKTAASSAAKPPQWPKYTLILEEIDELVGALFEKASRNPKAYFGLMINKPEAKEFLIKDNAVKSLVSAVAE